MGIRTTIGTDTGSIRTRWAAIGAAVAVTLGAGGLSTVGAAKGSGERAVYTAIEPCRLADTRPNQAIGPKTSPMGPGEVITIDVWGSNGECDDIPGDVVAVGLNVTAVGPTVPTHFTIWAGPASPVPNSSSLNPSPGQPPTPNAVTADLHTDGTFNLFNLQGNVNVIIDLVGIYQDHHHDDRYYTKGQVDALLAPPSSLELVPTDFQPVSPADGEWTLMAYGWRHQPTFGPDCVRAPLDLPTGAEITTVSTLRDSTGGLTSVRIGGTAIAEGPPASHTAFVTSSGFGPTSDELAWNVQGVDGDDDPTLRRGYVYSLDVCSEVGIDLVAVRVAWT